jgi:hypothetical protein
MKRQCVDRKKTRFNDAELTGGREKRGKKPFRARENLGREGLFNATEFMRPTPISPF